MEDEIYLKVPDRDAYIRMLWSSNYALDDTATGVIGIYVYDSTGNEHPEIEGGEMDVYDEGSLSDHIGDVLEFIEIPGSEYEMMESDEFESLIDF